MALKIYAFSTEPAFFQGPVGGTPARHRLRTPARRFVQGRSAQAGLCDTQPQCSRAGVDDGGYLLWESNAIVEYFASLKPASGALPQETHARLSLIKWMFWESSHWDQACAIFVFQNLLKRLLSLGEPDAAEIARGSQLFESAGQVLNSELQKHRYVAGDQFTAADLSVGADMCLAEAAQYPVTPFAGIRRWYDELRSMPSWQKTAAMQQQPGG